MEKSGYYVSDSKTGEVQGPFRSLREAREHCTEPTQQSVSMGYRIVVEHVQEYLVFGMGSEQQAKESACRFAAGNEDCIPPGLRVVNGNMIRNEVVFCHLEPLA